MVAGYVSKRKRLGDSHEDINRSFLYFQNLTSHHCSSEDMCRLHPHIVKEYWGTGSGHALGFKLSYCVKIK